MKKRLTALAVILSLCMAMTACSDDKQPTSPATNPATVTEPEPIKTIALTVGETNTVDNDVEFTLFKVVSGDKIAATIDDAIYFENHHDGKTYVDVVMDVTNLSDAAKASHELLAVTATGKDDTRYSSVLFATEACNGTELVQSAEITPEETVRLHAAVEVDEAETALMLTVTADDKSEYCLEYTLGDVVNSAQSIKSGSTVQSDDGDALTLVSVSVAGQVNPSNTEGRYSYYNVKDEANAFVYVEMNILNNGSEPLSVDEAVGVTVTYPDGVSYNGFTVVEAEDQKSFVTDAKIEPKELKRVLYLVECPTVPTRTEVDITIAFDADEYTLKIGIPATEPESVEEK